MIKRKLILTGGREGLTGIIDRRWRANNGVITLEGNPQDVEALTRYLGRCYRAYPEGSEELRKHGKGEVHSGPEPGEAAKVSTGLQSQQPGPAGEAADNGSGADGAPAHGAEHGATGSGHQNTGLDQQERLAEAVRTAVSTLDPDNDEQWTIEGLPKVDVIATLVGKPDLSRKHINQFAKDMVRSAK